jgi:hypothetical protein
MCRCREAEGAPRHGRLPALHLQRDWDICSQDACVDGRLATTDSGIGRALLDSGDDCGRPFCEPTVRARGPVMGTDRCW